MPAPIALHPAVWRADQLGQAAHSTVSSGWPALDAALPGGGWPLGSAIELLANAEMLPWRLLQPALQTASQQGPVVLIGLPLEPNVHAWAAHGIAPQRLLRILPRDDGEALWAAEQVLRCPDTAACWLFLQRPHTAGIQRLQCAASAARRDSSVPGAWPAPLVCCSTDAAHALPACAATLRLQLEGHDTAGLRVRIRKRRGPPLLQPIHIHAPLPIHALLSPGPDGRPVHHHEHHAVLDRLPALDACA